MTEPLAAASPSATSATASARFPIGSSRAIWFALLLVLAHFVVIFALGGLIARPVLGGRSPFGASPGAFLLLLVVGPLDVAVLIALLRKGAGIGLRALGWRRLQGRDVGLGLLGLAFCLAVLFGTGLLQHLTGYMIRSLTSFTLVQRIFFVLVGVLAAFGEETIFRGYLQPTLQRKLGRAGGLVATAIVFALYHLKLNPMRLLTLTGLGLVYGGLRDRTGGLWAGAISHALVWAVMGST